MPIPRMYETMAVNLEPHFRFILYISVGGFLALLVVAGLGAGLRLPASPGLFEGFRIAAHGVSVGWLLGILVLLFHPTWGALSRIRRGQEAMVLVSWLLSWFSALLIDFGVVAVALSLVLT